jgi:hypothetical protein
VSEQRIDFGVEAGGGQATIFEGREVGLERRSASGQQGARDQNQGDPHHGRGGAGQRREEG